MLSHPLRFSGKPVAAAVAAFALLLVAGCSEDNPVPFCDNCEIWDQLTPGLARYPDPHPTRADFYLYSTIEKTPRRDLNSDGDFDDPGENPSDATRESDEDLWLLFVTDPEDPTTSVGLQLTDDANMGAIGDNFAARWSPGGGQILFSHVEPGGILELWRIPVDISGASVTGTALTGVVVGAPERVVRRGRDGEWITETEITFTEKAKLYRLDLGGPGPRGTPTPVQLTFDPPIYASTDTYADRHPDVAVDGAGVFNTLGRLPVGSIEVEAFELDGAMMPVPTNAYLSLISPGGIGGVYPLFEGSDTLRTPAALNSLPLPNPTVSSGNVLFQDRPVPTGPVEGNIFVVGVRLDRNLDSGLADSVALGTRSTYCDTTLVAWGNLDAGQTASTSFLFEEARGTLRITTDRFQTTFNWERADRRVTLSSNFPGTGTLANAGDATRYNCLLSYGVNSQGLPDPSVLEPYTITATSPGVPPETTTVTISPGDTTFVTLFESPEPGQRHYPARQVSEHSNRSRPPDEAGVSLSDYLRAEGDLSTIWSLDLPPGDPDSAGLAEVTGSTALIQNPALTRQLSDGVRYVTYVSDIRGDWDLYVQKLKDFVPEGDPVLVPTPGTLDNLSCTRTAFHPRFVGTPTTASVRIVVGLADCPDNGFEDLGFDDDPWAIGEIRLWEVTLTNLP